MNSQEFKDFSKAVIDYIADYHENIRQRPVLPSVAPGYLRPLIPDSIPEDPDSWRDILKDMDRVIMPGVTHWQAPGFHAYYPAGGSYPSIVGELMSAGLGVLGFTWMTSPACTELEMVMMDWLAKAMGLPEDLLNSADSEGGGCLQSSACEATLLALLVAKEKTVRRLKKIHPEWSEQDIKAKLVCYSSTQANVSVEKTGLLGSVPMRLLSPDVDGRLRGQVLEEAIKKDIENGFIPCYLVATYGTTGSCAFDDLGELGPVCQRHDVWLHLDAAYAGVALICPELRHHMPDLHLADSIVTNLHKWLLVNFDCSAMWFKSSRDIADALTLDRVYLPKCKAASDAPDLRNWQLSLSRRFRSLKVWFTLRAYGLAGLQAHILRHVSFAQLFETKILQDPRFELAAPSAMGLVCFRLKGGNSLTKGLLEELTRRKKIHLTLAKIFDREFLRFVVNSPTTVEDDIDNSVKEILTAAKAVFKNNNGSKTKERKETPSKIEAMPSPENLTPSNVDNILCRIGCRKTSEDVTNSEVFQKVLKADNNTQTENRLHSHKNSVQTSEYIIITDICKENDPNAMQQKKTLVEA